MWSSQKEGAQEEMIDIFCKCGSQAIISSGEMVSVKCESCGRNSGPHDSFDTMYRKWYGLVSERRMADPICQSMKNIIMEISSREGYIQHVELLAVSADKLSGRRALNILVDAGLLRTKFLMGEEELSHEQAVEAKKKGTEFKVLFKKAFSRNNK